MLPRFLPLFAITLGAGLALAQDPTHPSPAAPLPAAPPADAPAPPAPPPAPPPGADRPLRPRARAAGERGERPPGGRDLQPGGEPSDFQLPPGPNGEPPVGPNGGRPPRGAAEGFQPRGEFAPGAGGPGGPGGPESARGDAVHRPGQPASREGEFFAQFNPRPPERLQPYLGVITRPVPPELAAQLPKSEGFGLVVDDLLPDSPASAAGLLRNDLIVRFDDQWLVLPPQLEALVRRAGKDHEVALTILRGGEEKKLTLKVGEKMLPERRPMTGMEQRWPGNFEPDFNQDNGPRSRRAGSREAGGPDYGAEAGGEREFRYLPERARIFRQDPRGIYELNLANGEPTFIVKNPDGTVAWQGPVKTPEQRQAIPKEYLEKLAALQAARTGPRFPRDPRFQEGQFPPGQPQEGQPRPRQFRDEAPPSPPTPAGESPEPRGAEPAGR